MDPLAVIYNENQWRIYHVSPLNNLQYDELKLKQYALKIRQSLVSAVTTNGSAKYTISIEDLPLLKYTDDDPHSFMITVFSTVEQKKKIVYNSVFLSWGKYTTVKDAIHLPYMLERGEQKVSHAVRSSLQIIFDCNITDYKFSQFQLLQIGFNFIENDTSRSMDPFTIVYRTPQSSNKTQDRISLTFEVGDIQKIFNSVKEETNNETDLINSVYQHLQYQIFIAMSIDVTIFDICEVILPKAEVRNNGCVKMKTPELVNAFFTVLNSITDFCTF